MSCKNHGDIGGFPVGQYLTDEFYVGRALGIGIDKTKVTTELSENGNDEGNGGSSSGGSSDNSQQ